MAGKLQTVTPAEQILIQIEGAFIHFLWAFDVTLAVLMAIRAVVPPARRSQAKRSFAFEPDDAEPFPAPRS